MLKIVIADDEKSIVELIKNLVETPDVSITGEAFDGLTAYSLVCKEEPDVLITDIRMPGFSGIELIERVKEKYPGIEIIVISGYRDFEYARSALQFGVNEYLLKPIKKSELNDALVKVKKKKLELLEESENQKNISQKLEKSLQLLRSEFLVDHLLNWEGKRKNQIEDKEELFHFQKGVYCVAILKVDGRVWQDASIAQMQVALESVSEKIFALFQTFCYETEYIQDGTKTYFILNYQTPENGKQFEQFPEQVQKILKNENYKFNFLQFTFALGCRQSSVEGLGESCRTAEIALKNRIDLVSEALIDYETFRRKPDAREEYRLADDDYMGLMDAAKSMDAEKMIRILDGAMGCYIGRTNHYACIYDIKSKITKILENTLFVSEKLEDEKTLEQEKALETKFNNLTDFEEMKNCLFSYIRIIVQYFKEQNDNKDSKPIRIIKNYVEEHYMEPITLEEISSIVFLSPAYISSAFKAHTGISFSSFLIDVRIEKAKALLRESLLNINEIAQAVGYRDVKHFSKLFKKNVGINPMEYRRFYA